MGVCIVDVLNFGSVCTHAHKYISLSIYVCIILDKNACMYVGVAAISATGLCSDMSVGPYCGCGSELVGSQFVMGFLGMCR